MGCIPYGIALQIEFYDRGGREGGESGNDNAAAANAMDEIRSFHILGVCVQTTFCHDHPPLSLTFASLKGVNM